MINQAICEPVQNSTFSLYWLRSDADDYLLSTLPIPEGWQNEDIEVDVHIIGAATEPGTVILEGHYRWNDENDPVRPREVPDEGVPFRVTEHFEAGDCYIIKTLNLGPLRASKVERPNQLVLLYLRRPAASDKADSYKGQKDSGTPSANVGIVSIHALTAAKPKEEGLR